MEVLFIGSFFPSEISEKIRLESKGAIANANDALQWSLIDGFSHIWPGLKLITMPQVGGFPLKYRSLWLKGLSFKTITGQLGKSLQFLNVIGIKHISRYVGIKRYLNEWAKDLSSTATIIIYDLHPPFLKAAADAKRNNKGIKICLIVPDLHGYTGGKNNLIHTLFGMVEKGILDKSLKAVDYFVLLSEHMKDKLPIKDKPWTVVEGVFNPKQDLMVAEIERSCLKTIFYSGSLDRRNGILNLVNAFQQIEDTNFRLIICGDGDTKSEIVNAQKEDNRIEYKGQLARNQVLEYQRKATLLVNPRTPEGDYTRYSFPSKTMEYMASGVPVLMYKLQGVPTEYFKYCFSLENDSIVNLKDRMTEICNTDQERLHSFAKQARKFILDNKNPKIQCEKIAKMLI